MTFLLITIMTIFTLDHGSYRYRHIAALSAYKPYALLSNMTMISIAIWPRVLLVFRMRFPKLVRTNWINNVISNVSESASNSQPFFVFYDLIFLIFCFENISYGY